MNPTISSRYSFILIKFGNILFASSCINYDRMDAKWQNASFIMFSFLDNRARINLRNNQKKLKNWNFSRLIFASETLKALLLSVLLQRYLQTCRFLRHNKSCGGQGMRNLNSSTSLCFLNILLWLINMIQQLIRETLSSQNILHFFLFKLS